jgi:serralysin
LNLNPTWQNQDIRGAAIPGAPDNVQTATEILKHVDYVSGGASLIGAGFLSAIGYLTPADTKAYFSPNMSFDFTLLEFGIPTGSPPVAVKMNAADAEVYWANEYDGLMKHASQPIVHWPWHDYGPTSGTNDGLGYTLSMFQNTVAKAFNTGAEFATAADVAQRISTFKNAKLTVQPSAVDPTEYTATVAANNVGKFSIGLNLPTGQKIQRVNGWYAYNDDKVFLDDDGGTFVVKTGLAADPVTHITELPMRVKLISLSGDGTNLNATFEGEGTVKIALNNVASNFTITASDDGFITTDANVASVNFTAFGTHTLTIALNAVIVPTTTPIAAVTSSLP